MNTILKHITSRAARIGAMACSLCVGLPAVAQDAAVAEAAEEASSVSAVDTIWVLLAAITTLRCCGWVLRSFSFSSRLSPNWNRC